MPFVAGCLRKWTAVKCGIIELLVFSSKPLSDLGWHISSTNAHSSHLTVSQRIDAQLFGVRVGIFVLKESSGTAFMSGDLRRKV